MSNRVQAPFPDRLLAALTAPDGEPDDLVRRIFDALAHGVLLFDNQRRLLFANAEARRVFEAGGVAPAQVEEALNQLTLLDPKTEAIMPREDTPVRRCLRGEDVDSEEILLRRRSDSQYRWLECSARAIHAEDGHILGATFTFRDITALRREEIALRQTRQLQEFIYRENLAGILHTTIDGRIIDCNNAAVRMLGYASARELMDVRAPQLYMDPEDRNDLFRMVSGGKRLSEREVCLRRSDGTACWALIGMRLLDAPVGEVGGTLIKTIIDITERKRSEETLRKSEQRFAAFMHFLPGIAFIKDMQGRYVFCNDSLRQFGHEPSDMIGKTDVELWPADLAEAFRAYDALVISTRKPREEVQKVPQADGIHTWLTYKFPIEENGQTAFVGAISVDVTERRLLEEQLMQAGKMEALGRLAGGVAHDFNNLLTVISGYGQLALESLGHVPNPTIASWMEDILNSARRAAALTEQLLAFSRHQVIEPRVLDLGALVQNMERLLQRMIGEHIELNVRASGRCIVLADPNQMEQVVMNLAVNARDAMPLGGILDIRCECIDPDAENQLTEPVVRLTVTDTGVGMDAATQTRIFDPFFTSKRTGKGTGLGLSTVYGIVSEARGRIQVISDVGAGATFRIDFPAALDDAMEEVPAGDLPPKGAETVLLVEDEPSVRALAETVLGHLGYKVISAESGAAALRLWEAQTQKIDILLTDVIMPQMSGGELASRLRVKDPDLKVLFMSGYTDELLATNGALPPGTQLMQKPFTARDLGRKLRAVLDA